MNNSEEIEHITCKDFSLKNDNPFECTGCGRETGDYKTTIINSKHYI